MSPPRYDPDRFPPKSLDWPELLPLIGRAQRAIAGYEGVLYAVPNPDLLLSPLAAQEAVLSSRIEGTRSSLSEVLAFGPTGDAPGEPMGDRGDAREVLNYRLALDAAIRRMKDLPLSLRLIREAHEVLTDGVRGGAAQPGEFRRVENWIGPPNSTRETATLLTCPVPELDDAMSAWERYLHEEMPDALVQLGVVHAWFEAIHPFLDGNGRLGRLMAPLFLKSKGVLQRPHFYLSEYLERHRHDYYRTLLIAQRGDGWAPWLRFFLRAIGKQAVANTAKARRLLALHDEYKDRVQVATRSQHAVRVLDFLFEQPVFHTTGLPRASGVPKPTAARILRVLRDLGMLRELWPARGRRSAVLWFPELIGIAERPSEFGTGEP